MMSEVLLRRTEKRGRETSRLMCCEDGRGVVENICLVQDAVTLGTFSDVFFWEEGTVNCGLVATKALPKCVTYQIRLMVDEPPYKETRSWALNDKVTKAEC